VPPIPNRFFGLPVPSPLSLDRLYADFRVLEMHVVGDIPSPARTVLERFAAADTIFVKSQDGFFTTGRYWAAECRAFFAADNALAAAQNAGGLFAIFARWRVVYAPLGRYAVLLCRRRRGTH